MLQALHNTYIRNYRYIFAKIKKFSIRNRKEIEITSNEKHQTLPYFLEIYFVIPKVHNIIKIIIK